MPGKLWSNNSRTKSDDQFNFSVIVFLSLKLNTPTGDCGGIQYELAAGKRFDKIHAKF